MILEHVEPGAEIVSDFWRGYNSLKHYYRHTVVNKAKYGCGGQEYKTTNHVEGMWAEIKAIFAIYNSNNVHTLQMMLDEALWRLRFPSY